MLLKCLLLRLYAVRRQVVSILFFPFPIIPHDSLKEKYTGNNKHIFKWINSTVPWNAANLAFKNQRWQSSAPKIQGSHTESLYTISILVCYLFFIELSLIVYILTLSRVGSMFRHCVNALSNITSYFWTNLWDYFLLWKVKMLNIHFLCSQLQHRQVTRALWIIYTHVKLW